MHHIYHTEGFILKSVNFGEANKLFFIFTREFGLIKVTAQGARLLKSKLRHNLEDFSFCQISVVRGREVWRLTSAHSKVSLNLKGEKLFLVSRIFALLMRLLHGEEKNDFLFDSLKEGIEFLRREEFDLSNFECIWALKILSSLGYIGNLGDFNKFTESPYFTADLLDKMSVLKTQAILEINKSLKETHL